MSIKELLKVGLTGNKSVSGPVFLKEDSKASRQLQELEQLYKIVNPSLKEELEKEMRCLRYGIAGEEAIAFELRNSHIPMVVLHDLYLEYEGLTAQIDYLIITRKCIFVVECKNLYGNITVNNNGDFIRTITNGKRIYKEGIYSPITQNTRHMELLKKLRLSEKGFLSKMMFERYFSDIYKSVVVLANSKTVVDVKYAKKDVKEQIIRCDQLIKYIKDMNSRSKDLSNTDKEMLELGKSILKYHSENTVDYYKKYRVPCEEQVMVPENCEEKSVIKDDTDSCILEETPLYTELKRYRLEKSRLEKVKPYFIFTNAQLEEIVCRKPENMEELDEISGFGKVKCEKYGGEILDIVRRLNGSVN